ncbi:mannose-specific lectin-like [Magnolia sinica]|uniref:mannose-specific lectin-like n=1 Tax=Magnolia sinica TaxID=86752 RepID=UPI0026586A1B|nr:mannose-specific lectin-like [Magnolia sinica]
MAIPVVLIVFLAISTIFTPPCTADSVLYTGERLEADQSLITGNYELKMEDDCNVVLLDNHEQIWESGTSGKGSFCFANLTAYGEFAIFQYYTDEKVWGNGAKLPEETNCVLIVQRNRDVVVHCNPLWSTETSIQPATKALGRNMGIGNSVKPGPKALGRAFVLVNSEGESELGSMITQVVNE